MGVGPNPGEFYELPCVSNDGKEAVFSGTVAGKEVSIQISLPGPEWAEYYKVGTNYAFAVKPEAPKEKEQSA